MNDNPYRLPRTVIPERYDLRVRPDLEAASFMGEVQIAVDVLEETSEILINAVDLAISNASATDADGRNLEAAVSLQPDAERAALNFAETVEKGKWTLDLEFAGKLNDQLRGFYRSVLVDDEGVEQIIATTQFESTDARRAFPCWDEPNFKAVFSVTLDVADDLLAVSNAAEISREPGEEGRVVVEFADTIKMSTYLVAFIVGPLETTEPVDVDGVPLRIVHPRGKGHLTAFGIRAGVECLRYLRDYYGIPYAGDKIDMIALPDFAHGAMENLGAITFRDALLLVDPDAASQKELVRIYDVIAHELAHMWFGNLVTMDWWEGIWLNEAFASLMEMKTTDAQHPEWKRWLAFASDAGAERSDAMELDSLQATRPVEFEVHSPHEADEMFDPLTYGKGSAVLRMLEQFIGEDAFRRGVESYLRTHAYANTTTADLWANLDVASGEPVSQAAEGWILQGGYPRVDVERTPTGIRLTQTRFQLIGNGGRLWKIPLQISRAENTEVIRHLMEDKTDELAIGAEGWVNANAGGHGFYRVRYSPELLAVFDPPSIDPLERYTLLDDTFAFVLSGGTNAADFLSLAARYRHEEEAAVWQMLLGSTLGGIGPTGHLEKLGQVVDDRAAFSTWIGSLLLPRFHQLGWEASEDESDLVRRSRGVLISGLGRLTRDQEVVERCAELLPEAIAGRLDPEVTLAVIGVNAATGDEDTFERFLTEHQTADDPQAKVRYLQALSGVPVEGAALRAFDLVLDGTIRNQDASWVVGRLLGQRDTGPAVWERMKDDWEALLDVVPSTIRSYMARGLSALTEVAPDVHEFFQDRNVQGADKAFAQRLELLEVMTGLEAREQHLSPDPIT